MHSGVILIRKVTHGTNDVFSPWYFAYFSIAKEPVMGVGSLDPCTALTLHIPDLLPGSR